MEQNSKGGNNFQRLICDCADELRDYWLGHQSAQSVKEIMSLSLSQQRMMRKVWRMNMEQPDGVMLKDLAEKLSLSCSAVSVMVDTMVKQGVLVREPARDDRRKVMIRVSENGLKFSRMYEQFFDDVCREFAAEQCKEDMETFVRILNKLNIFLYNKTEGV